MKKYFGLLGLIGFALMIYGLSRAMLYDQLPWYAYYAIGGTLFLGYANYKFGNESFLTKLVNNRSHLVKSYALFVFATIMIEFVGRYVLGFWEYPSFSLTEHIIWVFLLGYPFPFFMMYETYVLVRTKIKSVFIAFWATVFISAFAHELPNTLVYEWAYNIPYISTELFNVPIVVYIGWSILIAVPLIANALLYKQR